MFRYGFPKSQFIINCARTIICNSWDQNYLSGDILYAGGNVDQQEYFGFSSSLFKKIL